MQAETKVSDKGVLKIPIAVLKVGETRVLRPNVEFPSASVTFKLIQGTGPVYVYGLVVSDMMENEDWHDEDEDIEDEYDDEIHPQPQTNGKNSNKKK